MTRQARLLLNADGAFLPRSLTLDRLHPTLHGVIERLKALKEDAIPSEGRALLRSQQADLLTLLGRVEATPPPSPGVTPDPALLERFQPEEVDTLTELDRLIAERVNGIHLLTSSRRRRPVGDPLGDAARRVYTACFAEGRGFLTLPLDAQHLALRDRLAAVDPADAATLQLEEEMSDLHLLNAHLNALLQHSHVELARDSSAHANAEASLQRLALTVAVLWPDPTPAHAAQRRALLAPWLQAIGL